MSLPQLIWNKIYFYILEANFGEVGAHLIFIRGLRNYKQVNVKLCCFIGDLWESPTHEIRTP